MKIRRFFATDIKTALKQVSEELGPEAAIMSTRKTKGGVEVVAATDYEAALELHKANGGQKKRSVSVRASAEDTLQLTNKATTGTVHSDKKPKLTLEEILNETPNITQRNTPITTKKDSSFDVEWSQEPNLIEIRKEVGLMRELLQDQLGELAWHDKSHRTPIQAALLRKLVNMGFPASLASTFSRTCTIKDDFDIAWSQLKQTICAAMPRAQKSILKDGGVVALIGPTGVGKTTTIAKLAAHFVAENGPEDIALVTTDSYRVAAHEQLRTYANIMGISMRVADDAQTLSVILDELTDKKLILIDTAGISQRDQRLATQMSCLMNSGQAIDSYLVLSTTAQTLVIKEAIKTFSMIPLSGTILTKLDESVSLGESLGSVISENLEIAYITDGQKVPEDLHLAKAENLFEQAAKLGVKDTEDWVTAMALSKG